MLKQRKSMLFKSEILITGIAFAKTLAQLPKDIFIITRMFTIALFVIARNWKQPQCSVIYSEIRKLSKGRRQHTHANTVIHSHL